MKITLQHETNNELEIIIKGDTGSDEVKNIVTLLDSCGAKKTPKMILGKKDEREYILHVIKIESIYTKDTHVYALYDNVEYKLRAKLYEIENQFSGYGFRRISKGVLLNCNHIVYLEVEFSGNYSVVTKSNQKMTISRKYVTGVKQYIKEELV